MATTATSFLKGSQGSTSFYNGNKRAGTTYGSLSKIASQPSASKVETYNNGIPILSGLGYLGEKLAVGFMSSVEGIWDFTAGGLAKFFGADDWAEQQISNDWFGDWYSHPEEWYNPGKGWQVAGDIAGGIGTSLPAIGAVALTSVASGGALAGWGASLMAGSIAGLGAAGNATKQAYRETGELGGKEFAYGALSGATEGLMETFSSFLGVGTGKVVKSIAKALGKETVEGAVKKTIGKELAKSFLGEAFEEGVSELLDPWWQRATYNPDAKNATAKELAYSAFVGGMSGLVMGGADVSINHAARLIKGKKLAEGGKESEVTGLSKWLIDYESENKTEDETFTAISETYKKLTDSLTETGGKAVNASQRKLLGDLQAENTKAIFKSLVRKSAINIYNNADVIAEKLNAYGYKTSDGKPITFTAEQIRAGIDSKKPSTFSKALKNNEVLRSLAVADATGRLMMDTSKFVQATLMGQKLASQVDLNRFLETATREEIRAVSEALKIDDWSTLNAETFNRKITEFVENGGVEQYANKRAEINEINAIPETSALAMPKVINMQPEGVTRYTDGDTKIAVKRTGDAYSVFDYGTQHYTKNLTNTEVNKLLSDYNTKKADMFAEAKAQAEAVNEMRREAEALDTYARENIADYNKLSSPNQSMIRKVIRDGRARGISDEDVLSYAKVSARSGIDVVYSKEANYQGKNKSGQDVYSDGFYDPASNRIVINPESKRAADSLLIHELEHAIIKEKGGKKLIAAALRNTDKKTREGIINRYGKVYNGKGLTASERVDIYNDEISAHYAEGVLGNKNTLEKLLEAEPTMKEKILSFFKRAETDYADVPKLSRAAKRYYNTYKKLFDEFSAKNQNSNSLENPTSSAENAKNAQKKPVTRTNEEKAQDTGRRYAIVVLDNGNMYVTATRKVIKGDTIQEQRKEITHFFDVLLESRESLDIHTVEGDILTITKAETANKARDNYKTVDGKPVRMSDDEFKIKLKAESHIDEIAEIARNDNKGRKKADTKNHDFAQSGFNYRTAYFEDFDGQYYKITLSIGEKGDIATVYNVGKIEKNVPSSAKIIAVVGSKALDETFSDISIQHSKKKSNPSTEKSSEKSSDRRDALPATDENYLEAVERGDMETAQRMVDEAAKKAGYNNLFYHGAKKGGGFTKFKDWQYFTENKQYAERYTDRDKPGSLYTTYVKMENPFDTRKASDKKLFNEIRQEYGLSEIQASGLPDWTDGYDISDYIDENDLDYDGIVLDEGGDLVDGKPVSRGLSYVVRKSAQIKSADPVTYDDNGKVIPLSERFNTKKSDIRYALPEGEDFASPTISTVAKDRVIYKEKAFSKEWRKTKSESAYIHAVDEMFGVQTYLEKVGKVKNAKAAIHNVRSAPHQAQTMVGSVQYNIFESDAKSAQKMGEGLNEIFRPVERRGEKAVEKFNDYLLHQLNVDKYDANERMKSQQQDAVDSLHKLQDDIKSVEDQIKSLEDRIFELGDSEAEKKLKHGNQKAIEELQEKLSTLKSEENGLLLKMPMHAEAELQKVNKKISELMREKNKIKQEIFEAGNSEEAMARKKELKNKSREIDDSIAKEKEIAGKLGEISRLYDYSLKPVFFLDGKTYTREDSIGYIEKYEAANPEFRETAEKVWRFNKNLNKMRVSAQLISESLANRMATMYPHYIPSFKSEADNSTIRDDGVAVSSTVKKAKGYNSDIIKIKDSIAAQVSSLARNGNINVLANKVFDAASQSGDTKYVDIGVPEDLGVERSTEGIDRPKPHEITFFKNGNEYKMNVSDEIYAGFKGISEASAPHSNVFARAANWLTDKYKKLVTSYSPAFMIRNAIRDLQDAGINSKHPALFAKNLPIAWKQLANNSKNWETFRAYGGFSSSVFDRTGVNSDVGSRGFESLGISERIAREKGLSIKDVKYLKALFKSVENMNAAVEVIPRFAEYLASIEAGETIEQAIYNSAEVTTNFARRGATTKALNSTIIPFLNPAIQGFDKIFRNFTDAAKAGNAKAVAKSFGTLLAKAITIGMLPMLFNSLMYDDDEDYKDLREEDKENNYLFKLPNGTFLKLPRGRVASVIGGLYNRTAKTVKGEDADWGGYASNVISQVTPVENLTRTIFSPWMDVAMNHTWYGTEIEGAQFDNVRPRDRYDESTSSIAIAIGQAINYSPKKIHYLIDQYSGVIGDFLLPATTSKAEKDFFSGNFTIDPATSNKLSTQFNDIYQEAQYSKSDNSITAQYQVRYLNRVKDSVSEMYDQINAIQSSDLSNSEKLQQVRVIRIMINEAYKTAIADYDSVTKAIEDTANMGFDDSDVGESKQRYAEITKRVYGSERALKEYNSDVYAKMSVLNSAGVSYDKLYDYYFLTKDIKSDVDRKGNVISGSKRKKVVAAINSLGLSTEKKLLLIFAKGYSLQDGDIRGVKADAAKKRLLRYILRLSGKTKEEKAAIAEMCGFEVKNGRIITKSVFSSK